MARIDRYTCTEVFRRLDDYLDGRLPPEEVARIDVHLDACAECASEYRFEGSLLDGLKRKLRRVELPKGLEARIAEVLRRARAAGRDGAGADEPD